MYCSYTQVPGLRHNSWTRVPRTRVKRALADSSGVDRQCRTPSLTSVFASTFPRYADARLPGSPTPRRCLRDTCRIALRDFDYFLASELFPSTGTGIIIGGELRIWPKAERNRLQKPVC